MTKGNRLVRTWISLVIAVVFAIAAMPGSMAMPAAKLSHAMIMSNAMHEMACCAHDTSAPSSQDKNQDNPCKSMAVCFGLLSCYGMAALPLTSMPIGDRGAGTTAAIGKQSVSGLSIPPDDPPPIVG